MYRTLIIYESKYGFTETVVKNLTFILGPAQFCKADDFRPEYKDFDFFVIGVPIYKQTVDAKIAKFITDNAPWLMEKKIALFCTCQADDPGKPYLKPFVTLLGESIVNAAEINNQYNLEKIVGYALKVKKLQEDLNKKMPVAELKPYIDDFLRTHNTCTLSTAHLNRLRSTPMEYTYKDGYMYFITEGGKKYANLLINNHVSIASYDNLVNWSSLAGIQLSGLAELVDYGSEKYLDIIRLKKLKPEKILAMPVRINVIQVKLLKAEYLNARFKPLGYAVRQFFTF